MEEFGYFIISGDPFGAGTLDVTGSGRGTFLDPNGDGDFIPDTSGTLNQITIDTPAPGTTLTTSAYPDFGGTGSGVEVYNGFVGSQPITFAYISAGADGFDDGVDRIVVLSGALDVGDQITGITLDAVESDTPLDFDTVVCFAEGTLIRTPEGDVPVEALAPGDLVVTRDHGAVPVRWVGRQTLSAAELASAPNLQPMRIPAGALGDNVPARDLTVSPQHKLLVTSAEIELNFGCPGMLVPAKHLRVARRIRGVGVTYFHLMFDRHEIVLSNGAWSESLFVGPMAERSAAATEFRRLFGRAPATEDMSDGCLHDRTAAPVLRGWEGRLA